MLASLFATSSSPPPSSLPRQVRPPHRRPRRRRRRAARGLRVALRRSRRGRPLRERSGLLPRLWARGEPRGRERAARTPGPLPPVPACGAPSTCACLPAAQHDAGVLAHIASATGGTYAYVEDPGRIAGAFSACLAALLTTATRDMTLVLQVGSGEGRGRERGGEGAAVGRGAPMESPTSLILQAAPMESPAPAAAPVAATAVASPVLAAPTVAAAAAAAASEPPCPDGDPVEPALAPSPPAPPAPATACRILEVLSSYPHAVAPGGGAAVVK